MLSNRIKLDTNVSNEPTKMLSVATRGELPYNI